MPAPLPELPLLRSYRIHWHLAEPRYSGQTSTPVTILGRELSADDARDLMAGMLDTTPDAVVVDRVQLVATMGADLEEEPEERETPRDCERCGETFDAEQAGTSDDPALCGDCTAYNDTRITV